MAALACAPAIDAAMGTASARVVKAGSIGGLWMEKTLACRMNKSETAIPNAVLSGKRRRGLTIKNTTRLRETRSMTLAITDI